jgi:hypothetical protein
MTLNIAIISKNAGLEGILSQHPVLSSVAFSSHNCIDDYKKAASGDELVILDADSEDEIPAGIFKDNSILYLSPKAIGKYHLSKPFRLMDLFTLLAQMVAEIGYSDDIAISGFKFSYTKKILSDEKQQIDLTEKEAEIIMVLLDARPNPMDKKELLNHVWGYDDNIDTHTLETHMYRLRKKIGEDKFIVTDKDGYKIT